MFTEMLRLLMGKNLSSNEDNYDGDDPAYMRKAEGKKSKPGVCIIIDGEKLIEDAENESTKGAKQGKKGAKANSDPAKCKSKTSKKVQNGTADINAIANLSDKGKQKATPVHAVPARTGSEDKVDVVPVVCQTMNESLDDNGALGGKDVVRPDGSLHDDHHMNINDEPQTTDAGEDQSMLFSDVSDGLLHKSRPVIHSQETY